GFAASELSLDRRELTAGDRPAGCVPGGDRVLELSQVVLKVWRRVGRGPLPDARKEHLAHALLVGRVRVGRARVRAQPVEGLEEPSCPLEYHPEMGAFAWPARGARREEHRGRRRHFAERRGQVKRLQNDRRRRRVERSREGSEIEPYAL